MHLAYFDENKHSRDAPHFFVGGILIDAHNATELEDTLRQIQHNFFGTSILAKNTEYHGKDMFHGKGNCKGRAMQERVALFEDVGKFIVNNKNAPICRPRPPQQRRPCCVGGQPPHE